MEPTRATRLQTFGLVLLVLLVSVACAASQPVPLLPNRPDIATKLKGQWKGGWYEDNGARGRFDLNIDTVEGDRATGNGVWYDTVVGTAPFGFSGTFKEGALWIERGANLWFDLKLYESGMGHELRGRYSTIGLWVVYQGGISTSKK